MVRGNDIHEELTNPIKALSIIGVKNLWSVPKLLDKSLEHKIYASEWG